MAAKQMEEAQKARRKSDYESSDDEVESESEISLLTSSFSSRQLRSMPHHPLSGPSSFDPYSTTTMNESQVHQPEPISPTRENSLFDDGSVHTVASESESGIADPSPCPPPQTSTINRTSSVPGAAGYLEMEEEPPRDFYSGEEPITTSSGLLLTHRRPSPAARKPSASIPTENNFINHGGINPIKTIFDKSDPLTRENYTGLGFKSVQRDYFEVEHGFFAWKSATSDGEDYHGNDPRRRGLHSMPMLQARRFLSYVRIWMVISAAFLALATGVLFHSFGHKEDAAGTVVSKDSSNTDSSSRGKDSGAQQAMAANVNHGINQIILVPMEGISERQHYAGIQQQQFVQVPSGQLGYHTNHYQPQENHHHHRAGGVRRALLELRQEFEDWAAHHGKRYHSQKEKEHRFRVWTDNNRRTLEKNRRHGPCKLTKQAVFGSNRFSDLSPEEFKAQFLTGYKAPTQDEIEASHRRMDPSLRKLNQKHRGRTLKPGLDRVNMHESIKQRLMQEHGYRLLKEQQTSNGYTMRSASCDWYDISCLLRWLWNEAGIQFGSIVGTMEPRYDANAFPNKVDWRDYGVVTDVRSQGNCGACWAITAVETVESAHAISRGNLYDLSETEIILCDDTCEMCSGGWPQNAFEWVMKYGGLPLYNTYPYDGDKLLAMNQGLEGQSNTWTEDSVKQYRQGMCPSDDKDGSHDNGEDSYWKNGADNKNYGDYSDQGRYGNIKGYGYATDRCICYSDGSGCECDKQDEELAVANVASYGPAVVCLEASLWQDYSGGIITTDIGCGSGFMDVNHCVQLVGYAFTDGSNSEEGEEDEKSHSGSGSRDEGSSGKREGYWIVRNQWGGYWGMNGYAYVAMGANTCGILNDMTQAYL